MFLHPFPHSAAPPASANQEGELFKVIHIHGKSFPIYYGFYEDCDRHNPAVDPMPIYPDFTRKPQYTEEGFPFVTKMQTACNHYRGRSVNEQDCAECEYYKHGDELLGICVCMKNRVEPTQERDDASSRTDF